MGIFRLEITAVDKFSKAVLQGHAGGRVRIERITKGHILRSPVDERMSSRKVHPTIKIEERDGRINRGEVDEVKETPGWGRIIVQTEAGAIDAVGPCDIAKASEMKETIMSRRGV